MPYGGTRDWRLWFRRDESKPWRMLGPGYCFISPETANRGLQRVRAAFPRTLWAVGRVEEGPK